MSIDKPLDQAELIVANDLRQENPGSGLVKSSASFVKAFASAVRSVTTGDASEALTSIAETVKDLSDSAGDHNATYLLSIVISEIRYLHEKFEDLNSEHKHFLNTDWLSLLVDADRKARQTRSRRRVRRIAHILTGAANSQPPPQPDLVEEMMRIAIHLADSDVLVLREAARIQGRMLSRRGYPTQHEARTSWRQGTWRALGLTTGDLDGTCSKLQSLGLLIRLDQPSNLNDLGPMQNDYLLRQRGLDFMNFVGNDSANEVPDHEQS